MHTLQTLENPPTWQRKTTHAHTQQQAHWRLKMFEGKQQATVHATQRLHKDNFDAISVLPKNFPLSLVYLITWIMFTWF